MLRLLHADIVFENVSGGTVTDSARGIAEFRSLAERGVTLFRSRRQTIRDYAAHGTGARVQIEFEAVLATDLGPSLRAGDDLRLAGWSTFEMRDGLIARLVDES